MVTAGNLLWNVSASYKKGFATGDESLYDYCLIDMLLAMKLGQF